MYFGNKDFISFLKARGRAREREWPGEHPLPLPRWQQGCGGDGPGQAAVTAASASVEAYEELASAAELAVQQLLGAHCYNSVGNLVRFYQEFRTSSHTNLAQFYRTYDPPITSEHYTCVGLALELLCRLSNLESRFPGISSCIYLVSCEESIEELDQYVKEDPNPRTTEKEHVMVAMQILIAGRPGVMLLDPGYHIARVITVMADGLYPHTGWFVQSDEPHSKKEYNYSFANSGKYIVWSIRETRNNIEENSLALIYVERPFLSPVEVTERRNLVYNFRSLLARDTKGHLIAGFYLKIDSSGPPAFTIFHQNGNGTKKKKIQFEELLKPHLKEEDENMIKVCNQQLALPAGQLDIILINMAIILADTDFITQLLNINRNIFEISSNN